MPTLSTSRHQSSSMLISTWVAHLEKMKVLNLTVGGQAGFPMTVRLIPTRSSRHRWLPPKTCVPQPTYILSSLIFSATSVVFEIYQSALACFVILLPSAYLLATTKRLCHTATFSSLKLLLRQKTSGYQRKPILAGASISHDLKLSIPKGVAWERVCTIQGQSKEEGSREI